MRKLILASLVYFSIAACSASTTGMRSTASGHDFITSEEIQSVMVPGWSTWDLISRLRPHFLTSRSAQSLREPDPVFAVVYLDEIYHGELESLKTLKIQKIMSIQYLNPYDATTRFGTNMAGGAIMIRTH